MSFQIVFKFQVFHSFSFNEFRSPADATNDIEIQFQFRVFFCINYLFSLQISALPVKTPLSLHSERDKDYYKLRRIYIAGLHSIFFLYKEKNSIYFFQIHSISTLMIYIFSFLSLSLTRTKKQPFRERQIQIS